MKQVVYTAKDGRRSVVLIPDGAKDCKEEAAKGLLVGPPALDDLGLPSGVELALHNELYDRRLLTAADVRKRPQEVFAALQAALRVDVAAITNLY